MSTPPYKFGTTSRRNLATCHPDLVRILEEGIRLIDFTVTEGHRSRARQQALFDQGLSKARPGYSKHNPMPSMAADLAPHPIDWEDRERFTYLAGILVGIAHQLHAEGEIKYLLRWGGDWDRDGETKDNRFDDLVHVELVKT